ncbi:hypothetical protein BQ8794_140059 [Mesorhizobium prunaredense]|uniref:Uncharacterized protein n=1 Tax=Mesorhizobium prunaredense TaxID=1631249 RepID=A0A1R3V1Z4_9HYPH|nr:hypothetical protein BQ8794_140059 [Mesorhizobium prunaredense]
MGSRPSVRTNRANIPGWPIQWSRDQERVVHRCESREKALALSDDGHVLMQFSRSPDAEIIVLHRFFNKSDASRRQTAI